MGFSDLAAQVIFIFIFLMIFVTLFTSYRSYVSSTSSDLEYLYEDMNNRVHTAFDVESYNYTGGNLKLTILNSGSTVLDYELMDIFVTGERVDRDAIQFDLYDQIIDAHSWNPTERLNISFDMALSGEYLVKITSQYGVAAYERVNT